MRIGEIRNIIGRVLSDNHQIAIEQEDLYGGQAHNVKNYGDLIQALNILSEQNWNNQNYDEIEKIKEMYGDDVRSVQLPQEQFNQLNSYINEINSKVSLYYEVLDSFVEKQDEKTINIKLPSGLSSLEDLSSANKRLDDIFKLFNVDGEFQFKGFDRGTEWYVLVGGGVLSYRFVIACIKIGQEYLKMRTEYFKTKQAEIAYEMTLKDEEKKPAGGFEKFKEEWLNRFTRKKVEEAVEVIGTNGQTQPELASKLVKATTKLVKELDAGAEFHLSLNPPAYAQEHAGSLVIDYKQLAKLKPKEKKEVKQVEAPKLQAEEKQDGQATNKKG